MPALQLTVTLNGTNYPLSSCRWIRTTPGGHATHQLRGDAVTTPEAAAAEFTPGRRDREREHRRGIRYRLITPDQWTETKPCLTGDCQHAAAA